MLEEPEPIQDIDYDQERAKLFVRFIDGDSFVFVGVPGEVHRSFVDAESKARFFVAEISGRYPYNRVES